MSTDIKGDIEARDAVVKELTDVILVSMSPVLYGILKYLRRSADSMKWVDVRSNSTGVMVWGVWHETQPEFNNPSTRTFMCGIPHDVLTANDIDTTCEFLEETHRAIVAAATATTPSDDDGEEEDAFMLVIDDADDEIESLDELEQRITNLTENINGWVEPELDESPVIAPADISKKRVLH